MKISKQELINIVKEEIENEIKSLNEDDGLAAYLFGDGPEAQRLQSRRDAWDRQNAKDKEATDDEARAKREPLEKKRRELDMALYRTSRSLPPRANRRDSKPGFFASREEKMAYERRQDGLKRMKALEAAIAEIDKQLEAL
jgi:hypothetical protein